MNNSFDPGKINELIGSSQGIIDLIKTKNCTIEAEKEVIEVETKAARVDFNNLNNLYGHIAKLVETGSEILEAAKYAIDTGDIQGETIAAVSSLLNTLNETLKELLKIHQQKEKLDQQKELEKYKAELKKELLELKYEKQKELMKKDSIESDTTNMIQYSQEMVINMLLEKQKQKNNLIEAEIVKEQ